MNSAFVNKPLAYTSKDFGNHWSAPIFSVFIT